MNVKLSEAKVRRVRKMSGIFPQWLLALEFGVTQQNISYIVNRVTWRYVR